mmetsp:Transcript_23078/g.80448  ORF Transcript_23078/g.80448 Transcript_23078/m.80448 type:complete len:788 (-) Transcript_23078:180-2543(-)
MATAMFSAAAALTTAAVAARRYLSTHPPRPKRVPSTVVFGDEAMATGAKGALLRPTVTKTDPYAWLRDDKRKNPAIIAHLERENAYCATTLAPLQPLREALYAEFLSRTHESDVTFPTPFGGEFEYYQRTVKGTSYPIVCRVRGAAAIASARAAACATDEGVVVPEGEQVLIDVNDLARGHDFCDVSDWEPSPSHGKLAFSVDYSGYETYEIHVRDVATGRAVGEPLRDTTGSLVWGADDSELYYTTFDAAHRPHKVWRHVLGRPQAEDECLLTEDDERYWVSIRKSDDDRYLVAKAKSTVTAESALLRLGEAGAAFHVVQPRVDDMLYSVEPYGDRVLIVTNADASIDFKLCAAPLSAPGKDNWVDVLPHREGVKIDYVSVFETFWAVGGRAEGLSAIWTMAPQFPAAGAPPDMHLITPPEPVYRISMSSNYNYGAKTLRYSYSSPTTPNTLLEFDPATKASTQLKRVHVPGHDPSLYRCVRASATARDGRRVPISILFRPDAHGLRVPPDGALPPDDAPADAEAPGGLPTLLPKPSPLLLYGYGSYGASMDPSFQSTVISLVDRGIVYAIAHIRGGGEMGRAWYEREGKLLAKRNTFTDFVDCAEALLDAGWAEKGRLGIMGASAGGLLMGAVMNMRPELFSTVVARVPFTDVMSTMADRSIPLTVVELDEWGDPHTQEYYEYMNSYSPIDNVGPKPYPHTLVTAGLNDSRVAYWEPAKWVATLRDHTTSKAPILLKCEMGSGHFSASDRYRYLREQAFDYAFLCDSLGATALGGEAAPAARAKL